MAPNSSSLPLLQGKLFIVPSNLSILTLVQSSRWQARCLRRSPRGLRNRREDRKRPQNSWRQAYYTHQNHKERGATSTRRRYPRGAIMYFPTCLSLRPPCGLTDSSVREQPNMEKPNSDLRWKKSMIILQRRVIHFYRRACFWRLYLDVWQFISG